MNEHDEPNVEGKGLGLESLTRVYFDAAALFGAWPDPSGSQRSVMDKLRARGATLCVPTLVRWELAAVADEQRQEAVRTLNSAALTLRRHGPVPAVQFDESAARAEFEGRESETMRLLFSEVPLPDISLQAALGDSAAHRAPFKSREKPGASADRSFRDSIIQLSIAADFQASGAGFGLVVSPDNAFHDTVATTFFSAAGLAVVKTLPEVFEWLLKHVGNWFSEQQREEQRIVKEAVDQRQDKLDEFIRRNLKVPPDIARPGILKGVDDIKLTEVRSIVGGLPVFGAANRSQNRFVVDVKVIVHILEQPAIWRETEAFGIGEAPAEPIPAPWFSADYRERAAPALAWVEGTYTRNENGGIAELVFDAVKYGDWQQPLEDKLAELMVRGMFVQPEKG